MLNQYFRTMRGGGGLINMENVIFCIEYFSVDFLQIVRLSNPNNKLCNAVKIRIVVVSLLKCDKMYTHIYVLYILWITKNNSFNCKSLYVFRVNAFFKEKETII